MKHLLLAVAIFCLPPTLNSQTITKIFVVRHADRTAGDDLTPAGLARAETLKRVLGGAGIKRIYSTNFVRTKKTAKPLADSLGITTTIYATNAALIPIIKSTGEGLRHLVVGHSDTVVDFITSCGCSAPSALTGGLPVSQYDNLFVVLLKKVTAGPVITWKCEVMRMRYGASTN